MLKMWNYMGHKWQLHTLWCNLHMFLDILKFKVEKKLFRENMVSDLQTNDLFVHKTYIRKNCTKKKESVDKTSASCGFLRPHFQNSFP